MLIKLLVAWRLPLFVDEAFYWQEGQHLAWAYSDLPGLTAWLTRLGVEIGGHHVLAVRAPFLLIGALLPWLGVSIARRWFGETAGWQAGVLITLMPLTATLGLLALPDVPMALASLLCVDAGARLLQRVDRLAALELALGLAVGALSHYRFIGVIAIGLIALLMLRDGRRLLRHPAVIGAIVVGACAWLPLVLWNLQNGDAGLRFQLVDRHPWRLHGDGFGFVLVQAALVTPLLLFAFARAAISAVRDADVTAQWRYFGLLGGLSTLAYFVLGFFADNERVSFHWTVPGYLALLVMVPTLIARWPVWLRRLNWGLLLAGTLAMLGWYGAVGTPSLRSAMAGSKHYPANFAGWDEVAAASQRLRDTAPTGTRLLADNFKIGAQLGFALNDADIAVLDHPLNHRHGRARQLQLWGLERQSGAVSAGDYLLVIGADDVRYRDLLARYHAICAMVGPVLPAEAVNVDHGAKRYLVSQLLRLPATPGQACAAPAMAYLDQPVATEVARRFTVAGWAFREGIGLDKVEILLDGQVVALAEYGLAAPHVRDFWRISNDPNQPDVGFRAEVDAAGLPAGRHWLGLRLHGADGVVEDWQEQPIVIKD